MTTEPHVAQATLDDLVCRGAANDVIHAEQVRLLLEELDRFVDSVNQSGIGVQFFANLQANLQRELILGLTRLYEPLSADDLLNLAAHDHADPAKASSLQLATNQFFANPDRAHIHTIVYRAQGMLHTSRSVHGDRIDDGVQ
jgi:hypothetical protein